MIALAEPDARLPAEKELCEQLGVGRSTLRETMRYLAFVGAVQTRQGSGTFVFVPEGRTVPWSG
jgi:DNA-binding FadR family transcriptional regulator